MCSQRPLKQDNRCMLSSVKILYRFSLCKLSWPDREMLLATSPHVTHSRDWIPHWKTRKQDKNISMNAVWLVRVSLCYSSRRASRNRSPQCLLRLSLIRHRPSSSASPSVPPVANPIVPYLQRRQAPPETLACSHNTSFGIAPCCAVMGSSGNML